MNRLEGWTKGGAEVSIAGLGRSGVAATRLLASLGIRVYASDSSTGEDVVGAGAMLRQEFGSMVTVEVGAHDLDRVRRSAALVLSPGIPPTATVVTAAREAAVPVLAEAQLGLDALGGVPYVAITGTNGKSTTTALVDHLLRSAGRTSVAAGNIGNPLTAVATTKPRPDWLALELSSFQLHDMPDLMPTVGVLTNLAPDHLDRYATLEEYYGDKARLFANAGSASIWVSNLDDAESRTMVAAVSGRHLAFSVAPETRADAWYDRGREQLVLAGRDLGPRGDFPLLGDHNVANALAAALALHTVGVDHAAVAAGLRTFHGLPHRLEPVREVNGVLWINDSKATNVSSTRVAVEAMTRPFVLLLGGRHKGEPYTSLIEPFRPFGVAVVAYGESGDLVEEDLGKKVRVVRANDFEGVLETARRLIRPGGAVLLSPACSSYDMFDNYEHRGAEFRRLVEAM